jgi:hypothetical protein
MKQFRDLNACVAVLEAALRRDDIEPEQSKDIEAAIDGLKVLRRLNHPTRAEIFQHVRGITERVIRAFLK